MRNDIFHILSVAPEATGQGARWPAIALACLTVLAVVCPAAAEQPATGPKVYALVFDFHSEDAKLGEQLADSVRLRLRRHEQFEVIDRLTTQEFTKPTGAEADREKLAELLTRKMGANLGIYGTVSQKGRAVTVEAACLDLTTGKPAGWKKTFSDDTERARGVLAMKIVEAVRGEPEWVPPQVGDEKEPTAKQLGRPLNANGGFEDGHAGWDRPDNVSTFLEAGPKGRGTILRVRTDLQRDPWLKYRRDLRFGRADPNRPPKIGPDTSYGSVAGLEGVHYRGAMLPATPGQRYWLLADHKGQGGAKVFIKGFQKTEHAMDGLPESSLAELGLTPKDFAKLPPEKRNELIEADAGKHPERYLRECYRWYLNCKEAKGEWKHLAAPFPPRGGLPGNVEFLQVQIYSYWPPGEYLWDNVHVYPDPRQKAPAPEEKARTPNFGKTSDVVEKQSATKPAGP